MPSNIHNKFALPTNFSSGNNVLIDQVLSSPNYVVLTSLPLTSCNVKISISNASNLTLQSTELITNFSSINNVLK